MFPATAGVYTCMGNSVPMGGSPLTSGMLRRRGMAECAMACTMTATCRSFSLRTVIYNGWLEVDCQMNTGRYLTTNNTGTWNLGCTVQS